MHKSACPQYAFKMSIFICPAVHITSRSWLRSSSTPEPNDPLCSVVYWVCALCFSANATGCQKGANFTTHRWGRGEHKHRRDCTGGSEKQGRGPLNRSGYLCTEFLPPRRRPTTVATSLPNGRPVLLDGWLADNAADRPTVP